MKETKFKGLYTPITFIWQSGEGKNKEEADQLLPEVWDIRI